MCWCYTVGGRTLDYYLFIASHNDAYSIHLRETDNEILGVNQLRIISNHIIYRPMYVLRHLLQCLSYYKTQNVYSTYSFRNVDVLSLVKME